MDATWEWLTQELDVDGLEDLIASDSNLGALPPQSVAAPVAFVDDDNTEKNAADDTLVQNFLSTSTTSWGDFVDSVGVDEPYPDTYGDVEVAQGDDDDKDDDDDDDDMNPYPVPSLLPPKGSSWKMPIFILSHHHHIIQFVHVDPAHAPPRHATNLLSNSGTDISHHYHISRHVHHLYKCHVHIPTAHKEDIYWEPHVRMRSCTLGTFSTFSLQDAGFPSKTVDPNNKKQRARKEEKAKFVQLSHHFIHLHEVFCKDLCFNPPWLPKDHVCRLLHLQSKKPDPQGFFLMNVTIETTTHSASECKRWRDTNLGQFEHFHSHYHTLHINATKDPPSEEGPHTFYNDFMVSKESPYASKPTSPYST